MVKPAHHGPMKFELFQVTLLQSVKGKVQSATDQTNYCAPGGEFRCKLLPKAPLSSTAIKKLQFPTLQGRNPPFGNYIPDIQVPKGHVSSFPACKYMRSSTTGMRMNMSRLLQQKKALERGLAESLGCSDFLADSVGSLRTPWENDDPSRGITRGTETEL